MGSKPDTPSTEGTTGTTAHQRKTPPMPSLPGLSFRHFRGRSDYAQIAQVFTRSWEADGKEAAIDPADAARLFSGRHDFDPSHDLLIAETVASPRPHTVAFGRIEWHDEEAAQSEYGEEGEENRARSGAIRIYKFKCYIVPEWRGGDLERAMLLYYEHRLRDIAASHHLPSSTLGASSFFQTFLSDRHIAFVQVLQSRGYTPVRYEFEMVRPDMEQIPDLSLPEGLQIRPVEPEQLRAIWEAEVEAFRDHWGFAEPVEGDYGRWLGYPNFQQHLWQVAWDKETNQVAGMIRNYISEEENRRYGRQQGYTEWISVRRPWRRRGLARALLARSLHMHKELGMTQAALSVDSQNPSGALQLYESMGFGMTIRVVTYRKPLL